MPICLNSRHERHGGLYTWPKPNIHVMSRKVAVPQTVARQVHPGRLRVELQDDCQLAHVHGESHRGSHSGHCGGTGGGDAAAGGGGPSTADVNGPAPAAAAVGGDSESLAVTRTRLRAVALRARWRGLSASCFSAQWAAAALDLRPAPIRVPQDHHQARRQGWW